MTLVIAFTIIIYLLIIPVSLFRTLWVAFLIFATSFLPDLFLQKQERSEFT